MSKQPFRLALIASLLAATAASAAPSYVIRMPSRGVIATPTVDAPKPTAPTPAPEEPKTPEPVAPPQQDPATSLLLHMNGSPGSSSFNDEKGNGVAVLGGTAISAAYPAFGNGAANFNGVNQALAFSNEVFNFDAADYTVEAWVRPATGNNALQTVIANSWGWQLYWGGSSLSLYISQSPTGPGYYGGMPLASAPGSVPAGSWSHLAVVRKGSTLSLYTNGRLASSMPFTGTQVPPVYPASIGAIYTSNSAPSYYFAGQIDEVRVTKSLARYNGNFTPESQEFRP
jgi:hypothetical protein